MFQAWNKRNKSALFGLLAASFAAPAWANPCDDSSHSNFVYDATAQTCSCPGLIQAPVLAGDAAFCQHRGPNVVNEPPVVEASSGSGTSTDTNTGTVQEGALHQAARVERLGSTNAATIAIGVCAQGANRLLKDKRAGGVIIGSCLDALAAAQKLKETEQATREHLGQDGHSPQLEVNPALYADPEFKKQAQALRENYDLNTDDFVDRTLKTKGERPAFGRILRPKVSTSEFLKGMEGALKFNSEHRARILAELKPIGSKTEFIFQQAAPTSDFERMSALVAAHLHSSEVYSGGSESSEGAVASADGNGMSQFEKLTPPRPELGDIKALEPSAIVSSGDAAEVELSLFDVVHRKYRDKEMFRRLISNEWKRVGR